MNNVTQNMEIAPHGLLIVAASMLLLILAIHLLGFRALVGVRVGG